MSQWSNLSSENIPYACTGTRDLDSLVYDTEYFHECLSTGMLEPEMVKETLQKAGNMNFLTEISDYPKKTTHGMHGTFITCLLNPCLLLVLSCHPKGWTRHSARIAFENLVSVYEMRQVVVPSGGDCLFHSILTSLEYVDNLAYQEHLN